MKNLLRKTICALIVLVIVLSNMTVLAVETTDNKSTENSVSNEVEETSEKTDKEDETNANVTNEIVDEKEESVTNEQKEETESNQENIIDKEFIKEDVETELESDENIDTENTLSIDVKENQTLKDGTYVIKSAINNNYVVDVENSSKISGANVQIYSYNRGEQQRFNVKYLGEGYYEIEAVHSGKVLDVANAGKTAGTNVWQCNRNNQDAQKWIIQESEVKGYYYIISKCNGLYLDVANGVVTNGTNIAVCYGNKSNAQKFKFEEYIEPVYEKTIEDGTYVIKSAINSNYVVDVENSSKISGANVQLYNYNNGKQQRFNVKHLGNGYYEIEAVHSGKVLDVANAGKTAGTNVWQCNRNNQDAQKWIIQESEVKGYYYIISECNGLYLDVANGVAANGTNIAVCYGNKSNAQKFKFEEYVEPAYEKTIEDGTYIIRSAINTNYVVDVQNASKISGANVQLYNFSGSTNQVFNIKHIENGYYEIEAMHSGKVLDVANGGQQSGTNVWQCTPNGADAQRWIIKDLGDGYYSFISKCNGLYLDVANGVASNETNIAVCFGNNSDAQKFIIDKYEPTNDLDTKQTLENGIYVIKSAIDENFALDVWRGSKISGTNVQIYKNLAVNRQRFEVTYLGDGYYSIVAVHSNQALDVANAGKEPGTNVWQCTQNGADAQKWIIKDAKNGYYNVISKCNGLYLNIANGVAINGTNVDVCYGNGSNAQKFKFVKSSKLSVEEEKLFEAEGIDVSEHNGIIDWNAVKNSGQVDYAIIRAAYRGYGTGKIVTDMQFFKNITAAKANGLKIGLYFFTQAVTVEEAIEEANYVLNLIKLYNIEVTYPIAIDTEYSNSNHDGRADSLDVANRTAVCNAFTKTIEAAGYQSAIYASRNWFYENLDVGQLTNTDIWVAQYTTAEKTDYMYHYDMWQYTSSGSIPGISGRVDLNLCYKKY